MDPTPDELAGVTDLFGALTRVELHTAIENLAARSGSTFDPDVVDDCIDEALETYVLLEVETDDGAVYGPGPAAFPVLPEHGGDLPHMMDVPQRPVDRVTFAEAAEERLTADAVAAITAGDDDQIAELLDRCYEIDAWASMDLSETRDRLADALGE